jgi:hypothetical protein
MFGGKYLLKLFRRLDQGVSPDLAQTQQSRHQPQGNGRHFAEVPKDEARVARTGRSSPETAPTPGGFRGAEPQGEIVSSARAAHQRSTGKAFG